MLRLPILFVLMALLTACASRAPTPSWPEGAASPELFRMEWRRRADVQRVQAEEDYLLWVTRFYTGNGPVPGWLDMTEQVLERLPPERRGNIEARLFDLGGRIGAEWAKDNSVRRINTRAAGVWRDALLEALAQDDLDAFLDRLSADVDALRNGTLDGDAIRFERYYVDEFDF
ncbi:MAG: hypothetical protein SV422_00405 [Pseudomonadota bacterium]|nr:hypothetical protein [Pseudomonadota bacterium]